MKKKNIETLKPFLASLDGLIAAAAKAGLTETVALLDVARLDLLMRMNGIDPGEVLAHILKQGRLESDKVPPPRPRTRGRRRR